MGFLLVLLLSALAAAPTNLTAPESTFNADQYQVRYDDGPLGVKLAAPATGAETRPPIAWRYCVPGVLAILAIIGLLFWLGSRVIPCWRASSQRNDSKLL